MPWLVAAQRASEYDDGLSRIVFLKGCYHEDFDFVCVRSPAKEEFEAPSPTLAGQAGDAGQALNIGKRHFRGADSGIGRSQRPKGNSRKKGEQPTKTPPWERLG
jgi:hypothetical protein